ncbi:MAG TPA: Dam family site-specific DNA-(adenine-N6)-methyltransferase [Anaerolineae bacterium]|nr:Dam family site-specific DNA-(adenine-N6)-methyltransferase [Anaerolineae bacterium]
MLRCNTAFEPVIKWSGSKRKIAPLLAILLPDANCYYEPFVGGGAMLPFRPSRTAVAGDIIVELINLWKAIRETPGLTADEYEIRWNRLQAEGHTAYYTIRDSFNVTRNPHDLLFLSRTCVNGLIRFNKKGEFNNSLHHTRPGIAPARLRRVIRQWSRAIQGVEFIAAGYRGTLASVSTNDLVFLDPPYGGTKGRYLPTDFNLDEFYDELQRLNAIGAKWVLTFDGRAGSRSYATSIPSVLYRVRLALPTGNSPFTRLMKKSLDAIVESVYLNFEPPTELLNQLVKFGKQKLRCRSNFDVQQPRLFD